MSKRSIADKGTKTAAPTTWVMGAAGLAIGLGAAAWFLTRRHKAKIALDPERIIEACDAAAARLDEILFAEHSRQAG